MKSIGYHKNVVSMLGCWVNNDPIFLLLEYVPYGDLRHWLINKRKKVSKLGQRKSRINYHYYSFKIFPWFCLAKSTRIIHHNQLLMTKFKGILPLMNRWPQKCSFLSGINAPLTEKTWGRGSVVLIVKTKMADISLVSRVRTRQNNS